MIIYTPTLSGSSTVSGSLRVNGQLVVTGQISGTSSYSNRAITASYALNVVAGTSGTSGANGTSGTSGVSGNDAANSGRWYYNSSIATPSDPTNTYFNASSGLISSVTQIGISINTINSINYNAWFSDIKNTFDEIGRAHV